jgi:Holliday junction DNA helicase RuvB
MRVIRTGLYRGAHHAPPHKPAPHPSAVGDPEMERRHAAILADMHDRPLLVVTRAEPPDEAPADTPPESLQELREWLAQSQATRRGSSAPVTATAPESEVPAPSVRDRPRSIDDIVGQSAVVAQLRVVCAGARLRGVPMSHLLLSGPAGCGKTSLAGVVANELGAHLETTTGMMLYEARDLVGLLLKLPPGPCVLFIDEVHALTRPTAELLYEVLEDRSLSTIVGSGMEATAYHHPLPDLTIIGATTRPGLLTTPFRDRFGAHFVLEPYSEGELAEIVHRAWMRVGVVHGPDEPLEVARRCKGVPRRALHLAERTLDYCAVNEAEGVPVGAVADALAVFGIDELGLDETDFRILTALTKDHAGKAVGLSALAQFLDIDERTLELEYEPWLVRAGYLTRTRQGRLAMPAAYDVVREGAA